MKCPYCDKYGDHPTDKTHPKWYYWGDDMTPVFQRIAGRDIMYRKREKHCKFCYKTFETVEMWDNYLSGMVGEIQRLAEENTRLESCIEEYEKAIAQSNRQVRRAEVILGRSHGLVHELERSLTAFLKPLLMKTKCDKEITTTDGVVLVPADTTIGKKEYSKIMRHLKKVNPDSLPYSGHIAGRLKRWQRLQ